MVAGPTSAGPIDWFNNQGAAWCSNVQWAALDLSGSYRRVYEIARPNATQVADPLHVVIADERLTVDRNKQRLRGPLVAGDTNGEVRTAWIAKNASATPTPPAIPTPP